MRGINCRGLRLELVAALGIALALPVMTAAAANAQGVSTQTTLSVASQNVDGRTQQTASINVTGADGQPASGVVNIVEGGRLLSQVALNGVGQASADFTLPGGSHFLRAVYLGDATHQASASDSTEVRPQTSGSTPNFAVSVAAVSPATLPLTLTAGQAGTVNVTITPIDNAALTAPMFITLSCSGLPQQAACTFTPEDIEILPTTPTSCTSGSPPSACPPTSLMLLQTQAQTVTSMNRLPAGRRSSPVAWAFLLPGALGLGSLAWATRRRRWLQRLTLAALVGLVTTLGTTGCDPLYYYETHGPPQPAPTPSGTYNILVTAQSSNGITAITNSTTMVLTVN